MAAKKLKELSPEQYAFMNWLQVNHPNLMRAAEEHNRSLSGFMDSITNVFNSVMEKAPDLLQKYVAGKEQVAQLKMNIERAKEGQYPINPDGSLYAPRGVTPAQTVPTWVWFAGGGLLLALILMNRK